MTEHKYAPCGLDCAKCDIYVATQANDDKLREQVAQKWTKLFHYQFSKADINCDGCLAGGRMSIYCGSMCEIKPCAQAKGIQLCTACPDYECNMLQMNRKASAAYEQ